MYKRSPRHAIHPQHPDPRGYTMQSACGKRIGLDGVDITSPLINCRECSRAARIWARNNRQGLGIDPVAKS